MQVYPGMLWVDLGKVEREEEEEEKEKEKKKKKKKTLYSTQGTLFYPPHCLQKKIEEKFLVGKRETTSPSLLLLLLLHLLHPH